MIVDWIFLDHLSILFGIVGAIFGIVGTVYGIKKKREFNNYKIRTEKAKTKSYNAKAKAEGAREVEYFTKAIKNFFDMFRK